jgi:quercetin dioxygenase-like cupin family protein
MANAVGTPILYGDLRGTRFDFTHAGDVVSKHTHADADVHITIVSRGSVEAYSHDWGPIIAVAGETLDFKAGQPHEIRALTDGARIHNIIKRALPAVMGQELANN